MRAGVAAEALTDQGSNFMLRLLVEVYSLLRYMLNQSTLARTIPKWMGWLKD